MIIGKAEQIEISGFSLSTARFEIFGVEQQSKNIEKEKQASCTENEHLYFEPLPLKERCICTLYEYYIHGKFVYCHILQSFTIIKRLNDRAN